MNIVSIDFDIIMHRSVNLYNDSVDDDYSIQRILDENKNCGFIPIPDLFLYNHLTNFLIQCVKKLPADKIKFIEDHDEICQYFKENEVKGDFNIFNIDFHHDVAYADEDIENRVKDLDCGNWVKYLFERYPNFKQYIWINIKESIPLNKELFGSYTSKIFPQDLKKYNLDALVKSADVLYICRSSPWVPLEQQQLYETWKDIVDFLYKK